MRCDGGGRERPVCLRQALAHDLSLAALAAGEAGAGLGRGNPIDQIRPPLDQTVQVAVDGSISWRNRSRVGESIRPVVPVRKRRYYVPLARVKANRTLALRRWHPYRGPPWNLSRPVCDHVKHR